MRFRWGAAGGASAAILGVLLLAGLGAAQAPGDDDPLAQECIAAALQKPTGVKVSVRHAGHNSGRHQLAVLTAQYKQMPEACVGKYHRGNHAKAQALWNGRWARMNDYEPIYGYSANNQAAFTGLYQGLALVVAGEKPHQFNPCRVRILLKENVTRPEPHADSGYHPAHNVAQRIYTFPVPLSRISPHKGQSCSLLVSHRYPQAASSAVSAADSVQTCVQQELVSPTVTRAELHEPGKFSQSEAVSMDVAATPEECHGVTERMVQFEITKKELRRVRGKLRHRFIRLLWFGYDGYTREVAGPMGISGAANPHRGEGVYYHCSVGRVRTKVRLNMRVIVTDLATHKEAARKVFRGPLLEIEGINGGRGC